MTQIDKRDLTHGPILKKVLIFAIPLALTSMLQQLFNAADVAVVGRFASKQAMAAVGSNAPVVSLLVNFFVGLSVGANAVIAKNIGARQENRVKKSVGTVMILAILCGVFVAVLGNIIARPLIDLLGVPAEVADYSVKYLRIYCSGMPFIMLYNFEAAIFRSAGNTKTPLVSLTVGGVFNVIANLFFVVVLKMDVDGVAIATVLANVISSMILLFCLMKEQSWIKVDLRKLRMDSQSMRAILAIGLPSALQSMVFAISNLCVQSAVNSLGSDVMAAASAAYNIEIFIYFIINAFTQTCVTFVGQNYGAGDYRRCRDVIRKIILISWIVTLVSSGLLLIFMRQLLGLFTTEESIIELGVVRLKILLYSETVNMLMDNFTGAMRGLGKSLSPAIAALIGVCGIRITWVFTGFKIYHSWVSLMMVFPISWTISSAIMYVMYIKLRNKMLPITEVKA